MPHKINGLAKIESAGYIFTQMDPILLFYHGQCPDGTAALAVVMDFCIRHGILFEANPLYPGYNKELPQCKDRVVLFLDVTGEAAVINNVYAQCKTLMIIDHHRTALTTTEGVPADSKYIDMNNCASVLAWKFFTAARNVSDVRTSVMDGSFFKAPYTLVPFDNVPEFLKYIDDRDMWRNTMPNNAEVSAAVEMWDFEFDKYIAALTNFDRAAAIQAGTYYLQYKTRQVNEILKKAKVMFWKIDNKLYNVGVVNSATFQSELGNRILETLKLADFAAIWNSQNGGVIFNWSFRSIDNRVDTLTIGGKGHRNASGTQTSHMFTTVNESYDPQKMAPLSIADGAVMRHFVLTHKKVSYPVAQYLLTRHRSKFMGNNLRIAISVIRDVLDMAYEPEAIIYVKRTLDGGFKVKIYGNCDTLLFGNGSRDGIVTTYRLAQPPHWLPIPALE